MTQRMEKTLKQARLEKKLTLDDVTQALKIRKEHLRQFEKQIPKSLDVYTLGYLRSYAKYLGVDINDYIKSLKEQDKITEQEKDEKSKNKIFRTIKTPASVITIVLSLVGLIVSIVFLGIMNKKKLRPSYDQSDLQESVIVNAPNETKFAVEKKGPYDYLVTGIGSNNEINIIANIDTTFTMIDPATNKTIHTGAIKTGEQLFIPKDQDNKIFTSLLIKTNVPDAFDIQKN